MTVVCQIVMAIFLTLQYNYFNLGQSICLYVFNHKIGVFISCSYLKSKQATKEFPIMCLGWHCTFLVFIKNLLAKDYSYDLKKTSMNLHIRMPQLAMNLKPVGVQPLWQPPCTRKVDCLIPKMTVTNPNTCPVFMQSLVFLSMEVSQ